MLAIQKSQKPEGKCSANILPCRISHTGPVSSSERYWKPQKEDDKNVAYFRGRRLLGKTIRIPDGYQGAVVERTERMLPVADKKMSSVIGSGDDEDGDDEPEQVNILEETNTFDEIVVWGHETLPDDMDDPYVKGIEEWIPFAEAMHSYSAAEEDPVPSEQAEEKH
ncbi:MAG: 3'-5' exonuclease [Vezdaea acicularis]|nr:MAG: 3'-5' exonuclease [Vezdaea acicularis]